MQKPNQIVKKHKTWKLLLCQVCSFLHQPNPPDKMYNLFGLSKPKSVKFPHDHFMKFDLQETWKLCLLEGPCFKCSLKSTGQTTKVEPRPVKQNAYCAYHARTAWVLALNCSSSLSFRHYFSYLPPSLLPITHQTLSCFWQNQKNKEIRIR